MNLNDIVDDIVRWRKSKGFKTTWRNTPEKLMLVVTEVSEAMEAYRHEDFKNFTEEIVDSIIRLFDLGGSLNIDLEAAIQHKMEINKKRKWKHGKIC